MTGPVPYILEMTVEMIKAQYKPNLTILVLCRELLYRWPYYMRITHKGSRTPTRNNRNGSGSEKFALAAVAKFALVGTPKRLRI